MHTKKQQVTWTVMLYNTMLTVPFPFRVNGQSVRGKMIPEAIYTLHRRTPIDIIVMCELMDPFTSSKLLERFAHYGWVYQSTSLPVSFSRGHFLSGGVSIVSRYPIIANDYHVFKATAGSDSYVSKGIVYCEISRGGQNIHIFGTHLQAWDTLLGRTIRCAQAQEMTAFQQKVISSPQWPVLLCGDLNIDRYQQRPELTTFLQTTAYRFPEESVSGHKFTIDPQLNALVGNDDPSMYTTRSYPEGCYLSYLQHQSCACCPQEWVDYILYHDNSLAPLHVNMRPILLKATPYDMKFSSTISRQHSDLSDHFPLLSSWTYPKILCNDSSTRPLMSSIKTSSGTGTKHVQYLLLISLAVNLVILGNRLRSR